jgi:REP element-mobilizing transposase RayT
MSDKYKMYDPGAAYFVTLTIVDWIDIFTRPAYKHIIIDSLAYCQQNKDLEIYAWCLMSNHLHMVCRGSKRHPLQDILRDFKKYTSVKIIETLQEIPESRSDWMLDRFAFKAGQVKRNKNYKLWQDGNHAKQIFTNEFLQMKIDYIHNNPVRAELVAFSEDYLYSSARVYAGKVGLIEIVKVSRLIERI